MDAHKEASKAITDFALISLVTLLKDNGSSVRLVDAQTQLISLLLSYDYNYCIRRGKRIGKLESNKNNLITLKSFVYKSNNNTNAKPIITKEIVAAHLAATLIVDKTIDTAARRGIILAKGRHKNILTLNTKSKHKIFKIVDTKEEKPYKRPQKTGTISYYAGVEEWDGWKHSPIYEREILSVKVESKLAPEILEEAFFGWNTKLTSDGGLFIHTKPGNLIKSVVVDFLDLNKIKYNTLAVKIRQRRDLNDLPSEFLKDITRKNTDYLTKIILQRHLSAVDNLIDDRNDIPSIAAEIVLDMIAGFDEKKGVPFSAYASLGVSNKLQDLARVKNTRVLNDFAIKRASIISQTPSIENNPKEIAKAMGYTLEQYKKKIRDLSSLSYIQNPFSIYFEREDHSGDYDVIEIPVQDEALSPEDSLLEKERHENVRLGFVKVAHRFNIQLDAENIAEIKSIKKPNMIAKADPKAYTASVKILYGLKILYLIYWEDKTYEEITNQIGISITEARDYKKKAIEELYKCMGNLVK